MKHVRVAGIILLFSAMVLLTACGGGGGGGGGGSTQLEYTGATTTATISNSNAESIALGTLEVGPSEIVTLTSGIGSVTVSEKARPLVLRSDVNSGHQSAHAASLFS